jgi:hypothetical protein
MELKSYSETKNRKIYLARTGYLNCEEIIQLILEGNEYNMPEKIQKTLRVHLAKKETCNDVNFLKKIILKGGYTNYINDLESRLTLSENKNK